MTLSCNLFFVGFSIFYLFVYLFISLRNVTIPGHVTVMRASHMTVSCDTATQPQTRCWPCARCSHRCSLWPGAGTPMTGRAWTPDLSPHGTTRPKWASLSIGGCFLSPASVANGSGGPGRADRIRNIWTSCWTTTRPGSNTRSLLRCFMLRSSTLESGRTCSRLPEPSELFYLF